MTLFHFLYLSVWVTSGSDKPIHSLLLSKNWTSLLLCRIASSTLSALVVFCVCASPYTLGGVLSHSVRGPALMAFRLRFRVTKCYRQIRLVFCQHHVRAKACCRVLCTVVSPHHLCQIPVQVHHVLGSVYPQQWYLFCSVPVLNHSTVGDMSLNEKISWDLWSVRPQQMFHCPSGNSTECRSDYLAIDQLIASLFSFCVNRIAIKICYSFWYSDDSIDCKF